MLSDDEYYFISRRARRFVKESERIAVCKNSKNKRTGKTESINFNFIEFEIMAIEITAGNTTSKEFCELYFGDLSVLSCKSIE